MERFAVCGGVAGAKINLLLDVVGRRSDGYHRIDGVMADRHLRGRSDRDA